MTDRIGPRVSVIVPMYNVGEYIRDCIESVVRQTEKSWELILVDDGSPDDSAQIAALYADADSRVCLIRQPNQGVSAARNAGLDKAVGEFVCFVDGDDRITFDFLATMCRFAGADVDYVISTRAVSDAASTGERRIEAWSKDRTLAELIYAQIPMGCWNKLYRLSVLNAAGLRFNLQLQMGEGLNFIAMAASLCDGRTVATEWSGYAYRRDNPISATTLLNSAKMRNAVEAIEQVRRDQSPVSTAVNRALAFQTARTTFSGLVAATRERRADDKTYFSCELKRIPVSALVQAEVPLRERLVVLVARLLPSLAVTFRTLQHRLRH